MKLTIEIPKEFEKDFIRDKFSDCFKRLLGDTKDRIENRNCRFFGAGNYEMETLEMFIEAFKNCEVK